jgi:hypothetical protein
MSEESYNDILYMLIFLGIITTIICTGCCKKRNISANSVKTAPPTPINSPKKTTEETKEGIKEETKDGEMVDIELGDV